MAVNELSSHAVPETIPSEKKKGITMPTTLPRQNRREAEKKEAKRNPPGGGEANTAWPGLDFVWGLEKLSDYSAHRELERCSDFFCLHGDNYYVLDDPRRKKIHYLNTYVSVKGARKYAWFG
jgi:hypothetical protein